MMRPAPTLSGLPDDILERISAARVGGAFWAPPPTTPDDRGKVIRPDPSRRVVAAVDPWAALDGAKSLVTHGDDEWVGIAHLLGVAVELRSGGRYGEPGDSAADGKARLQQHLAQAHWIDPFTGEPASIEATIDLLAYWRKLISTNRTIAAACGMAWWKRDEIRRFLWVPERRLPIVSRPGRALERAVRTRGALAVWPSRISPQLIRQAAERDVRIVRVEDGFIRSAGLGSDLVPPSSVVVDHRGIHFDPSAESDLEHILSTTQFTTELCARAAAIRSVIVTAGIGKYSSGTQSDLPAPTPGKRTVLVAAQVEDDMSVLAGGGGITSNLEVLRRARAAEPEAEIWFRPHPDIEAGHRKGAVDDRDVLQFADRIVRGGGMAPLLGQVDAVHVLTSLTGFEALLRGCEVTCHGVPFYAGWGLTRDLGSIPQRRGRTLTLNELVAGVLILYPRYLDPVSGLPCPPEVLIRRLAAGEAPNRLKLVSRLRRWQGRFMARWR